MLVNYDVIKRFKHSSRGNLVRNDSFAYTDKNSDFCRLILIVKPFNIFHLILAAFNFVQFFSVRNDYFSIKTIKTHMMFVWFRDRCIKFIK